MDKKNYSVLTKKCRACGTEIVFLRTQKGTTMPVDKDTWNGEDHYVKGLHRSHFETCPKADEFRKRNKKERKTTG